MTKGPEKNGHGALKELQRREGEKGLMTRKTSCTALGRLRCGLV